MRKAQKAGAKAGAGAAKALKSFRGVGMSGAANSKKPINSGPAKKKRTKK